MNGSRPAKRSAPTPREVREQVSSIVRGTVVQGLRVIRQYEELYAEAYGPTGREKIRFQRGEVANPTLEILMAKAHRAEACAKFGHRLAGVSRALEAIANDLATALVSEGPEPEYVEEAQDLSPAERERIHREREEALRSA